MSDVKASGGKTEITTESQKYLHDDDKEALGDGRTMKCENETEKDKSNKPGEVDNINGNSQVKASKSMKSNEEVRTSVDNSTKDKDDQSSCDNLSTKETMSIGNKTELLDSYKRSPKTVNDSVNNPEPNVSIKRNIEPDMSHIRMEEIQWQRLLERKLITETQEREMEQKYRDEIKTQVRNIEKQKRTDGLVMKRRMVEFERRRRIHNIAFCRMFQKKGREYQIENEALYSRITEIDKQKQRNLDKLKSRVTFLEQKKQREQEMFLQRIEELDRRREEEYDASQKRLRDVERKKYNERNAWLLHVQKIEGLKKEIFRGEHDKAQPETSTAETETENVDTNSKLNPKNIKDQARVMEDASHGNAHYMLLPKIHHKKVNMNKPKVVKKQTKNRKVKNNKSKEENATNDKTDSVDDSTVEFRFDVTVLT